jgi:tetratricopeptide (TPR) repeat protein
VSEPLVDDLDRLRALEAAARVGLPTAAGVAELPEGPVRQLGLAVIAAATDDHAGALRLLDGLQGLPAALHGLVARTLGEALLGFGALAEVERVSTERLTRAPGDRDMRVLQARLLFRQRRVVEAEALLRGVVAEAEAAAEPHAGALQGLGMTLLATGRLGEAEDLFIRAIEADPLDPRSWRALAQRDRMAGSVERGIERLEAAAGRGFVVFNDPRLLLEGAELYAAAGRWPALAALLRRVEQVTEVGPGQAVELGRLWAEAGEVAEVERLAALGGPLLLAVAAELRGRGDRSMWNAAALAAPKHWLPHERLAAWLLDAEGPAAARTELEVARRLAPQTAEVQVTAARVALAEGDERARGALQAAADHPGLWPSVRARARAALA